MAEPIAAVPDLVRKLYAGIIEAPPWQGFLRELGRETDSRATVIMLSPPGSATVNLISAVGGQPRVSSTYRDLLFTLDPFVNLPEGLVTTLHEFVGAAVLERNDYYKQFMCARWGMGFVLGIDVRTATGYTARLRLCRDAETSDFEVEAHRLVETLAPYLREAIEIFDRVHSLRVEGIELHDALDGLNVASFLLDLQMRITRPNRCAEALLASGEGITLRNGQLVLASKDAQKRLAKILEWARTARGSRDSPAARLREPIVISRGVGSPPLALSVRLLRSPADLRSDHAPVVAVYVSTSERCSVVLAAATVRQLLGITGAEAELAARLARGDTVDGAAHELGVTRATARTQLYSIFRKTGVRRQSELVSLIAQTAARLPHQ